MKSFATLILLLLGAALAFGGQSLILYPGMSNATLIDPHLPDHQSWRVEFQIHDWELPAAGDYNIYVFRLDGTGATAIVRTDGRLVGGVSLRYTKQ